MGGEQHQTLAAVVFAAQAGKAIVVHDFEVVRGDPGAAREISVVIRGTARSRESALNAEDYNVSRDPIGIEAAQDRTAIYDGVTGQPNMLGGCER